MHYQHLDAHTAVRYCNLIIPKQYFYTAPIENALTIDLREQRSDANALVYLYQESATHLEVPREFLSDDEIDSAVVKGMKFIDLRYDYEDVDFSSRIRLRNDSQIRGSDALVSSKRGGVLNLACGGGKTVVSLDAAARIGKPTLVVVHTTTLMEQWRERILQFYDLSDDDVGVVQGKKLQWDRPVVVAMLHTVSQRASEWGVDIRTRFGTIIYDEVHHVSAPMFSLSAPLFTGKRIGLTATPTRFDNLQRIFHYHIGPLVYSDMTQDLKPVIVFQRTLVEPTQADFKKFRDRSGTANIPKIKSWLAQSSERTKLVQDIVQECLDDGRSIVVLGGIVEQLQDLSSRFPKSGLCIGAVPQEERHEIIKGCNPVFMTSQIGKEGLDKPTLDTVIFSTPFADFNMLVQGMGRVLRVKDGKKGPLVVFIDDFRIEPVKRMINKLKRWMRDNGHDFQVLPPRKEGEEYALPADAGGTEGYIR